MKSDVEVLQYISQNVEMGIIGINDVIDFVSNDNFCTLLKRQKDEFQVMYDKAQEFLNEYNKEAKNVSPIAKISTDLMSKMMIKKDDDVACVAKLMIEGTNKGIIAITEKLNNYKISNDKIGDLANKLKATLEHNVEDLKAYL